MHQNVGEIRKSIIYEKLCKKIVAPHKDYEELRLGPTPPFVLAALRSHLRRSCPTPPIPLAAVRSHLCRASAEPYLGPSTGQRRPPPPQWWQRIVHTALLEWAAHSAPLCLPQTVWRARRRSGDACPAAPAARTRRSDGRRPRGNISNNNASSAVVRRHPVRRGKLNTSA